MKEFFKSTKGKVITSILLVIALVGVGVGCYFIFRKEKLKFDYEKGAIAVEIVDNAQYTPDLDKFIAANSATQGLSTLKKDTNIQPLNSTAEEKTSSMTQEEFTNLVDEYATVKNYAGAGKYLGYDIYEIKNEIKYVVETVPAFNQWFRMPQMREKEGYVSYPYYEDWAYYLEMDEADRLSITRVCWCTRSKYLDFENQKSIEDHADGTSFVQYEIMKTNYYTDENGDEVVETFLYSVGIDNVENGGTCNQNTKDYYPFEYQYLKNVEDTSLIKYHITAAKRYRDDETFDVGGMDIRGLTPYGIRREFTIANYDGYTEVELTKIDQQFATFNHPEYDGIVDFNMNSNNIKELVENVGLSNEEFESATDSMNLLDKIAKQIIDNFEIKNNWPKIYKDSTNAIMVDMIKGPHYGKAIPISYVHVYVSASSTNISFTATADIYDMSKFDITKEYSLSFALRNRETGKLFVVATNYNLLEERQYKDSTETYYSLQGITKILNSSKINIEENGEYDVTCVLTVKENDEDVIMFDTLEIAYLRSYSGLVIPNSIDENGIEHKYSVKGNGGKLTITVSSVETNI